MSNATCPGIPANPDVSGIGIRISVYITTTILTILPSIPATGELINVLASAVSLNGFALVITSVVQTKARQLSFFHAIIIVQLLQFMGIAVYPAGNYKITTLRIALLVFFSCASMLIGYSWIIYVWATAPDFGPEEIQACNDQVVFVFFFVSVGATSLWLRRFFMALTSVLN